VAKAGNDSMTGFSPVAMWLASDPEWSSPDKRSFSEAAQWKFFVASWWAIFRRAANPRFGRILAA
jgi:hypothetical protein